MTASLRLAYLHGFASGPGSTKGLALEASLASRGHRLMRPDLNKPRFQELTVTSALEVMDALDASLPGGGRWQLVGSSMGGYLTALWASLHPTRVERMLLLCPGFDLVERWSEGLGPQAMGEWRRTGMHLFPDATGAEVGVHWGLVEDAARHPGRPAPPCPTRIVHGTHDEVVPIQSSRNHAEAFPGVELVEVDSDHRMNDQIPRIAAEMHRFFHLD